MKEEYSFNPELSNYTHLDALTLNVERACQAAIDLAMHITAIEHFGIPQNSADAFSLLLKNHIITEKTTREMIAMTGFRNIAIHEYQAMDMNVMHHIAVDGWKSLIIFCEELGIKIKP